MGDISEKLKPEKNDDQAEKREGILSQVKLFVSPIYHCGNEKYQVVILKDFNQAVYAEGLAEFNIFGGIHYKIFYVGIICNRVYALVRDGEKYCFIDREGNMAFGGSYRHLNGPFDKEANVYAFISENGTEWYFVDVEGNQAFGGSHSGILSWLTVNEKPYVKVFDKQGGHYVNLKGETLELCDIPIESYLKLLNELGVHDSYKKAFFAIDNAISSRQTAQVYSALGETIDRIIASYPDNEELLKRRLTKEFNAIYRAFTKDVGKFIDYKVGLMGDIADKVGREEEGIESQIEKKRVIRIIAGKEYQIVVLKNGKQAIYTEGLKDFDLFGGCHNNIEDIIDVCGGLAIVQDIGNGWSCLSFDGKLFFGGLHSYIFRVFDVCGGIAKVMDDDIYYVSYDGHRKFNYWELAFEKENKYYDSFRELGVVDPYLRALNRIVSVSCQASDNSLLSSFKIMIDTIKERYKDDREQLRRHLVHDFRVVEKALTRDIMKYMDCAVVPDG